jgi:hypothetical protein
MVVALLTLQEISPPTRSKQDGAFYISSLQAINPKVHRDSEAGLLNVI